MSTTIIGGSDGPTAVFIAGKTGVDWLNVFGLIIVVLILIPNIVYAIKVRDQKNLCANKLMNILEQVGRYGSIFLMCFNIGIAEFGFSSVESFVIYLVGNVLLLLIYWITWLLYFKEKSMGKAMVLALVPTAIFLLCGLTMGHWLLVITGILFGIGHVYVTRANH